MIRKRDVFNRLFNTALSLILSGSIRLEPLYPLSREDISDPRTLDCNFGTSCAWYTEGRNRNAWQLAKGNPDVIVWFTATGSNTLPTQPFAFLALEDGGGDSLLSGVLPCQLGDGILSFWFWLSHGATVYVCAVHADDGSQLHCSPPLRRRFGSASLKILGPIDFPFKLAIVGTGEGFLALDNLAYSASLCSESERFPEPSSIAPSTAYPPKSLVTAPDINQVNLSIEFFQIDDNRDGKYINTADDLICDFTAEWPCLWGPEKGKWFILDGDPDPQVWKEKTGTELWPATPSVLLATPGSKIVSDPILCQKDEGQILMKFWTSGGNGSARICAVSVSSNRELLCAKAPSSSSKPAVFDFPKPLLEPFTWHIIPDWPNGTIESQVFFVFDDLAYFGDICAENGANPPPNTSQTLRITSPSTTTTTTTTTTTVPTTTTTTTTTTTFGLPHACDVLNCDFNDDTCQYHLTNWGSATWERRNSGFGYPISRLTDIRLDIPQSPTGHFLAAKTIPRWQYRAILESPTFSGAAIKILEFRYYRASIGLTLKLCLVNKRTRLNKGFLNSCQEIIPRLTVDNARKWNTARALVMPSYTQFFLVAEHKGKNSGAAALAVDDLRILHC